jgi:DNA-binding NarL/FixJ family response regulator
MDARETAAGLSVPAHPGKGHQKRNLRLVESRSPADRAVSLRKKLPVSMVLVDPKPLTRRSIADLLTREFPEYPLVSAATCEELLGIEAGRIGRPNLAVLYIRSAGVTDAGVYSALQLLRARLPDTATVVLSDIDSVGEVNLALSHGVRGYIPTSVESEIAVAALKFISAGGTFVPADALLSPTAKQADRTEGDHRGRSDELDLTPRELLVVNLLREGKPNKLIAAQLEMQESTVKVHVRNILRKLNVANRTHAATVANRLLSREAK